jgi:predicted site-specific integrase-resolvase
MTLSSYVKKGYIKVTTLPTGKYVYDSASVFKFLKNNKRKNVVYARVSTYKQKNDLTTQLDKLKSYCKTNNIHVDDEYSEISSGLDLERIEFSKLLVDVLDYKVANIYITYKDRLTRLSFTTIKQIFEKFGTSIITIGKGNRTETSEVLEELISLMHVFSTRMYSNRRTHTLTDIDDDLNI